MNLKTFRAKTMAEALIEVKKDLGRDAVILHTRTYKVGGMFGLGTRQVVEITAADSAHVSHTPGERTVPRPTPRVASGVGATAATRQIKDEFIPQAAYSRPAVPLPTAGNLGRTPLEPPVVEVGRLRTSSVGDTQATARGAARLSSRVEIAPATAADADELRSDLSAIRSMMANMFRMGQGGSENAALGLLPDALFDAYAKLTAAGVNAKVAAAIIAPIRNGSTPEQLSDVPRIEALVLEHLGRLIRVAASGTPEAGRKGPHTVALLGPTGVGKTTTIAKLAALQRLRHGKRVGLVTADTYRIAAVDQLRTYANIIGLPVRVAGTPTEMERACDSLADCDMIFVDTAGRSPHDAARLDELREMLAACNPSEKHLVLSIAAADSVLDRTVERFRPLGPDRLLLTKLDEAVTFGSIANLVASTSLPIGFVTNGQEVPDQIEPANASKLAKQIFSAEGRP